MSSTMSLIMCTWQGKWQRNVKAADNCAVCMNTFSLKVRGDRAEVDTANYIMILMIILMLISMVMVTTHLNLLMLSVLIDQGAKHSVKLSPITARPPSVWKRLNHMIWFVIIWYDIILMIWWSFLMTHSWFGRAHFLKLLPLVNVNSISSSAFKP